MNTKITITRPTALTAEQAVEFYHSEAAKIIKHGFSKSSQHGVFLDLKEVDPSDTGFEIAEKLKNNGCGQYNVDSMFVEWLEMMINEREDLLQQNVKQWVKYTNPVAKFSRGQKIALNRNFTGIGKTGAEFYITGIKQETAVYYVWEQPDNNGGYIIPYEQAEEYFNPTE